MTDLWIPQFLYDLADVDPSLGEGTDRLALIFDLASSKWKAAAPKDSDLATTDVTTNNVTSSKHGFAPKSPGDAAQFLNGAATPAFAQVKDSDLATTDVTTNNATSSKHGFSPKSPADATQFLNGAATPAYALVKDSDLSTSDVTTNNASSTKHGFAAKSPADVTKFFRGGATPDWAVPPYPVTSVLGRTGDVVAQSGDYTVGQVTGAVQVAGDIGGTAASPTVTGLHLSADTSIGHKLTSVTDPTAAQDAATKNYVDSTINGLQIKQTATVATTAALPTNVYSNGASGVGATLTAVGLGALTVDSYAVALNDYVLVKNEVTASRNGLYQCTTAGSAGVLYVLTRATDMNVASEFSGAFVPVGSAGTTNANSLWLCNPSGAVTVGTTSIPFTQLNGATDLIAGTGISITGNTVAVSAAPESVLSVTDVTTKNVTSSAHGFAPKSGADATTFLNGAATPAYAQVKDSDLATTDVTTNNVTSTKHGFTPKSGSDATTFLNGAATPAYAQVKDSDLATTDVTTNNVTSSKHGFTPKSGADATTFLNGAATPAYAQVKDSDLATTDVTTNNVVSTKHGFAPKSPGDATQFLNGAATPAYAAVKDSDLSTTDITTNNSSSSKHGFSPKSPGDATQFLNGAATPAFAAVKDSDLSTTDITTNNATTSKHGFLPKLGGGTTNFLRADGSYANPLGKTIQLPIVLDTPDSTGNGYPALTTNNGFSNVKRVLPAFTKLVDGTWEGSIRIPQDYASGGAIICSFVANATSGAIRLQVLDAVVAAGVTEDTAYTAETAANTTVPGTARLRFDISTTLTTSPVAGSDLNVQIKRVGTNGGDTLAVDALLWRCVFQYVQN